VQGLPSYKIGFDLTARDDGVPTDCIVNFDDVPTPREVFRRRVTSLSPPRMAEAYRVLQAATGS
jgi:mRNA interferase MazF